jgi:hypothetical protein
MNIILVAGFFTIAIMAVLFFAVITLKQYSRSAMNNIAAYNAPQSVRVIKVKTLAQMPVMATAMAEEIEKTSTRPSIYDSKYGYAMSKMDIKNLKAANIYSALMPADIILPPQAA